MCECLEMVSGALPTMAAAACAYVAMDAPTASWLTYKLPLIAQIAAQGVGISLAADLLLGVRDVKKTWNNEIVAQFKKGNTTLQSTKSKSNYKQKDTIMTAIKRVKYKLCAKTEDGKKKEILKQAITKNMHGNEITHANNESGTLNRDEAHYIICHKRQQQHGKQ